MYYLTSSSPNQLIKIDYIKTFFLNRTNNIQTWLLSGSIRVKREQMDLEHTTATTKVQNKTPEIITHYSLRVLWSKTKQTHKNYIIYIFYITSCYTMSTGLIYVFVFYYEITRHIHISKKTHLYLKSYY